MIRYMVGPDVTMQLAYDEAVIRTEHRSWLQRFPRPQLAAAPLPGSTPR